jgi:Cof subfamily protein (haloacid dehalogenase superfamily)
MVFLDVDGTILSSKRELVPELIDVVARLKQKGVFVGIATGRSYQGAKPYGDLLGCDAYVVYNGGLVIEDENIIFDNPISHKVAHYACTRTHEMGGTYIHFWGNYSWTNQLGFNDEYLLPYASLCDISETNKDAHRLALYLNQEQRAKLKTEITEASCFDEGDRLEVFHNGSKWTGILSLVNKYNVLPEKVITIGDGTNDIGMLKAAGMGIAMGNAPECVKATANAVAKNNDEQGVVHVLKEIFCL